MNNRRIQWIDALRGFGVLLVVIGHLKPGWYLEKYIYAFHMVMFFSISGYLYYQEENPYAWVKKKCNRLLLPYMVWTYMALLPPLGAGLNINAAIESIFMIDGFIGWNRPIWFLVVLFVAEVVYGLMKRHFWFADAVCLVVCPVIWYMLKGHMLIMKLDIVPLAVFFLSFGSAIKIVFSSEFFEKNRKWVCGLTLLGSAFVHVFCGVYKNERIVFTSSAFGRYDLCLLAGMAGVIFFFLFFLWMGKNRILSFVGKFSLFIMCTHYYVLHVIRYISTKLIGYNLWNARGSIKAVLIGILVVAVLSAIGSWISRISKKNQILESSIKWIGL